MNRAPMKRGKRPKPMSDRRRADVDLRRDLCLRVYVRDCQTCQGLALVPDVACGGPLDVDEIIPRSAWAAGWLVDDNCQLLCRRHHDWKHSEPQAAREVGLRLFSWERELLPTKGP